MLRQVTLITLSVAFAACAAQTPSAAPAPRPAFDAFEVATINPVPSSAKAPRYITLQGNNRFIEKDYTLKGLIAAAYDLNPRVISGGSDWLDNDHYDITALSPGEVRPTHEEQMAMLRTLLTTRFSLRFHREPKEFSIYALQVAKGGPRLKDAAAPDKPPFLINVVYPESIKLPARNVTMAAFASMLQRAVLDRPVVDRTGLTGHYDFDLEWAPDDSQFGGDVAAAPAETQAAPFFTAIQQQLGLRLEASRGTVQALVVDHAERPTAN